MQIKLKRSNVINNGAAKAPTADQMEFGELAVNYSNGDPAVFLKDSTNAVIRIAGKGATGLDGDYVNLTGDTMTGQLGLPGGGSDTEAIQKQEVTALISGIPAPDLTAYLEVAGDNMTGDLTLGTDKIVLGADTGAADFESDVTANAFIGDGSQLTNLPDQVTGVYLPLTGGTLTGDLTAPKFIGDGSLLTNLPGGGAGVYLPLTGGDLTGDLTLGTDKITLDATGGSITAAGEIKVEGASTPAGLWSGISKYGSLLIGTSSEAVGDAKLSIDSGSGSLTTAGQVQVGPVQDGCVIYNDGTLQVWDSSSMNVELNANGNITAAGAVVSKGLDAAVCFQAIQTNESEVRAEITASGSATFAGTITAGDASFGEGVNTADATTWGVEIEVTSNAGLVTTQCTELASQFTELYRAYKGTTKVFAVGATGIITAGGYSLSQLPQL